MRKFTFALAFVLSMVASAAAQAPAPVGPQLDPTVQRKMDWVEPTTNADGTPLTDLSHYLVFWSQFEADLATMQPSGTVPAVAAAPAPGAVANYFLPPNTLTPGQWYFSVAAVDTAGNVSARATAVPAFMCVPGSCPGTVPSDAVAPVAPSNLRIR